MQIAHTVLLAGTFLVVFGAVLVALFILRPSILQQRLGQIDREAPSFLPQQAPSDWVHRIGQLAKPLARASLPKEGWEDSTLRARFVHAGWRSPDAIPIYFGIKTALAAGIPLALSVLLFDRFDASHQTAYLATLLGGALFGFYLPNVVLALKIKRRKRDIFEAFPDSLDLIMVCVEAGLGLDAAVLRVVEDMRSARPAMAEEYELLTLELRAGLAREKALRNFAARTGVDDVEMLVAMLIQADRFGTSVAESLRVHSDMLRTKRQMLAEERAAKIGTKVLFPLIFCLFPALYVVLLGPAGIQIVAGLRSVINN
ncbi:type II secretion system (T2SS), F family protein [Ralstonia insidiosa]|jgi:tight adherence protein C|uniref:Type II secretion system (T2SS), F family protein n=1 Tax=Ralstonia insidiosa TaxID=190721 RepID=A0AAC9BJ86_9RALS|nr:MULTISPECIES: type II secretion system F family protein [Ralstonia]ANH74861.1 type II secretion system (T2SS), F family protein [Ralstonia insidiosa]EPX96002.1 type II secretion system protein [Ralstonia sp. AU12-08]MBY4706731.1 type II secretion system F family protein [Ralstonia insidiosa]GAQ27800.1 type II secretion system protein [Ralstonia sp. NT80]